MDVDWIALIVSVAAFVLSIIAMFQTKKINDINLSASYYSKIFEQYLIKKIPEARQYLWFNDAGNLSHIDSLSDVMADLKNDALYFKYNNPNFYDELGKKIDDLENYLMELANDCTNRDEQEEKMSEISIKIEIIYFCIDSSLKGRT